MWGLPTVWFLVHTGRVLVRKKEGRHRTKGEQRGNAVPTVSKILNLLKTISLDHFLHTRQLSTQQQQRGKGGVKKMGKRVKGQDQVKLRQEPWTPRLR